jgi:hypothetical protein
LKFDNYFCPDIPGNLSGFLETGRFGRREKEGKKFVRCDCE